MENNFIQNLGLSEKELGTYTGTNAFGNFENSIASFSPVDGKKIADVAFTSSSDYQKVVEKALDAQLLWRKVPAPKRGEIVRQIGNQLRIDNLDTRFELYQNENNLTFPNGYQNNLIYTSNDLYLSAKYRFKLNKFSLLTQSDFHQLYNELETIHLNGAQRKKILELFQLSLSWHYKKFSEIKSLPILQAVLH